jgi:hypothetical protein
MRHDTLAITLVLATLLAGCASSPTSKRPRLNGPAITIEWAPRTICSDWIDGREIVRTCRLDGVR